MAALQGVARFERTHQIWDTFHDDQALSRSDFTCLRFKRWNGVISRHTTPEFAEACRELGIPLVDMNDSAKIPGVPKLRPDNHVIGRIAAARNLKLMVPEELAVIGTNNDYIRCELSYPRMSSVEINGFRTGYRAAEVLSAMLDGQDLGQLDERIAPTGVIARQSTDIRAVDEFCVAKALSIIRERACQGLTTDELTAEVHASRSQLEKKFRHYIGRSPQAEIRRVRLEKVRQLLTETDLPLKRIAEVTGFGSIEYLSVFFKRAVGETPGQFRAHTSPKPPRASAGGGSSAAG